jgi:3-hydroxyacyl-CoA dehydrogenase/enoyl-CoA hydratase/3-hydroxybutyryl-CoA epimerase
LPLSSWHSEQSPNVLDRSAFEELDSHLDKARADSSTTGLVIRSGKPEGFCAGADLRTILACQTSAQVEALLVVGLAVLDRLASLPFPTAAVIHGVCLGGGLELALACRWRVALASAAPLQIGLPEVNLGLVPAWGALVRLPRLIGPDDALDLLVSGRSIGSSSRGPWESSTAWLLPAIHLYRSTRRAGRLVNSRHSPRSPG